MAELLLEIGLEEIPARMIVAAEAELARRVEALLSRQRLGGTTITSYSTPRRLAVRVEDVLARRTRALFLDARAAMAMAPAVAHLMAEELNKDQSWEKEQLLSFNSIAKNYILND